MLDGELVQDGGGGVLLDEETETLLLEIETFTAAALRETAKAGGKGDRGKEAAKHGGGGSGVVVE